MSTSVIATDNDVSSIYKRFHEIIHNEERTRRPSQKVFYVYSSLLPTLNPLFAEENSREYIKLNSKLHEKWIEKSAIFSGFPKVLVFQKSKELIDKLLALSPRYVTFDLTEDVSVFFQASKNEYSIYSELFFTEEVNDKFEVVTNIYKDGKSILAYAGNIDETFSKIEAFVADPQTNFVWTEQDAYLSNAAFTATALY